MEESTDSTYRYTPLAPFRLLRIYRTKDGSMIRGHLQNHSLDSLDCPPFITISYVWGPPQCRQSIWLDGHRFPVLDSLYPILEAICDFEEFQDVHWVWVDFICINQRDLEERASQVQLMQRIYARSTRTIAWLGPETPELCEAVDFMHILKDNHGAIVEWSNKIGSREVLPDLRVPEKWRALAKLYQTPWWTRMWTLQESVVARNLEFFCGRKKILADTLYTAISAVWYSEPESSLMPPTSWSSAWRRCRLREWYGELGYTDNMGLIALMAYTGSYELSDPRDRIYALLGLAKNADCQMVGRPTYMEDVEVIYKHLVVSFIETYHNLDVICFAQLFRPPTSNGDAGSTTSGSVATTLPSWVPDWRVRAEPSVTPLMVSQSARHHIGNFRPTAEAGWRVELRGELYRADAGSKHQTALDAQSGRLVCRGVFVDVIDGIGTVLSSPDHLVEQEAAPVTQATSDLNTRSPALEPERGRRSTRLRAQSPFLTEIVRCLTLDRADRYLTDLADADAFRVELLHLVAISEDVGLRQRLPGRCRSALAWYHANKGLLLRGRTLEQLCHDSIGSIGSISWEPSAFEESFASRLVDTTSPIAMQRRLLVTEGGSVGMAPPGAEKGDIACVLLGCSVPVVLRKSNDGSGEAYKFIGECYIHGIMSGEIMEQERELREFTLV